MSGKKPLQTQATQPTRRSGAKPDPKSVAWSPQPEPQTAFINCPIPTILFGGARGGGKTDAALGHAGVMAERYGPAFSALFVRKELPMLDDAIERSKQIYNHVGATYNKVEKTWRWPNGARLRFRPLETTDDADKYQGQNITHIYVEEAGQYASPAPIDRLKGTLRSAHGVRTQLILTGNPGGAGQGWIKERYIDPCPDGMKVMLRDTDTGQKEKFVFIPSKVKDNKILLREDPTYVDRLHSVGSAELVKAWLEGDWNAIEGAFFDCFHTQRHVLEPFSLPDHWTRFRSMDWGFAAPFSVGWWAVIGEDYDYHGRILPKGALLRYREWYGAKSAGVGLRIPADEVARGIKSRERGEVIDYGVIDPSAFTSDDGPSIAEKLHKHGVHFRRADNRRVGKKGALGGWDEMRRRLIGIDFGDGERSPMLYCFSTCRDSIRTIPSLQHDQSRPEDLDTEAEDHAADEWRYACMSRPWGRKKPSASVRVVQRLKTLKELMSAELRERNRYSRL